MSDLQQQQTPPAAPQTLADLPDDNAPPQPIEVDIEAGETNEVAPPAADQQQAPEPKKPRYSARDKVQQAHRERDEARQFAQQLEQQLMQARQDAQAARAAEQAAMQSGMANYAARVASESAAAEQELQQALESGDSKAIAAANKKVAKAAQAEADVDAWKATQQQQAPQQQQQPEPQQQYQPRQQATPQLPPAITEFLVENEWFDVYKRGSDGNLIVGQNGQYVQNPAFDESMHDAAMLMHKRIEWEKRNGMWNGEIGGPEYVARIREGMESQFPEYFNESEDEPPPVPSRKTPPMAQARQPVAPATRSSLPGQQPSNGTKITLTGEERSFVDSMVQNGAMTYPRGHAKAGQKMAPKDAYIEYARQAQIARANPQQ